MALVLKGSVSNFAKAVGKTARASEFRASPFMKASGDAASERWILKPGEGIERPFHTADLPEHKSKAVLPRVGTTLRRISEAVTDPCWIRAARRSSSSSCCSMSLVLMEPPMRAESGPLSAFAGHTAVCRQDRGYAERIGRRDR